MRWMWKILSVLAFAAASAMTQAEPMRVASLSTVMADLARQIGGDRVEVVEIVKPGIDAHIYEPTPGDRRTIAESRILLANGLGFESYLENLRLGLKKSGVILVEGGNAIQPIESDCKDDHGHSHGSMDPHWWHSVANAKAVARGICEAFVAADPEGRAAYEANEAALQERLDDLAKWIRLRLAALPKSSRVLVTSHDALGYFAKENGFMVFAVQGLSTSDQPSSHKVRQLIDKISALHVKAIFAESIENPKVLEQITRESGAKPGGVLLTDGLGSGDSATYEGMMKRNVTTILEGLE